jgi:UDP-N-acetylmuramoyl-L-alanyl-D-glutamate--2,6-diaminopimelate ligase
LKLLSEILYKCELIEIEGSTGIAIDGITFDSRKVKDGDLFVAVRGLTSDGHDFISQALENGAVAVVCEDLPEHRSEEVSFVKVARSRKAMARIAANFYDNPSERIKIIGVTGTNGKTTIATLLHNLFSSLGYKTGLISTISNKIGEKENTAVYTTPDVIALNALFAQMAEEGCSHCFMEVSSHAIHQERVADVKFSGGIFTNITHDHLDYHNTFRDYINAKKAFFDNLPRESFAITNNDDKNGQVMLQNTVAKKYSYGLKNMADYHGKIVENLITGLVMQIDGREVWCKLVGEFNASNLMAIYSCCRLLGIESDEALTALSSLNPVEGRFDYFLSKGQVMGIVDYAHTPDALENVLSTIKKLRKGTETLITVVGCGGNRDAAKRPLMASISASYSDKVIITSDNPRFEEPEAIIEDMKKGLDPVSVKKALTVVNRREAIKVASAMAKEGDIILVAGKGHEKYQEIKGVRHHFDDKEILKETLD